MGHGAWGMGHGAWGDEGDEFPSAPPPPPPLLPNAQCPMPNALFYFLYKARYSQGLINLVSLQMPSFWFLACASAC